MIVKVHMLAFSEGQGKIRNVTTSSCIDPNRIDSVLNNVFYKGQNEFAEPCDFSQKLPSISCGDVIEYPEGIYHLVKAFGFKTMNLYQFTSYKKHMNRDERKAITHFFALGD